MRTLTLLTVALAAACGDPFGLPEAQVENRVDTVSLYALSGTPVTQPSAYVIPFRQVVRTDQDQAAITGFDFAFDIDTAGRALLLPTGALRLGRGSGIRIETTHFDSIKVAPTSNYQLDSAVAVDSGSVAILHSRPQGCSFNPTGGYVFYAKLRVLVIDTTSGPNGRRIDFEMLANVNCGHRGLEPPPPTAPTDLAAASVSASQIDLSWTDNATNEVGFRIERCAGVSCSGFAEIARVGANVESYQSTGLSASTSYSYRVRAYDAGGTSAYSNTATATTSTPGPASRER